MEKNLCALAVGLLFLTAGAQAQSLPNQGGGGVARMQELMRAIKEGNTASLPEDTRKALETGQTGATRIADMNSAPASTVEFATQANEKWQQMAREAYVAALPPKDKELGRSLLLGDGSLPGDKGKLYFFVSRSMPMSMLKAYALDALYTGGTLVVKGIRKGDTIKEYIEEAVNDFNNAEGQVLSSLEVNPNLYDMFQVDVVPSVVWTNRIGLEDIGAGCENLPEGAPVPKVTLPGPNDELLEVDRPTCAPAPSTAYYKLTGALTLPYVLDRFEQAGLSKAATEQYRRALAERHANAFDSNLATMPASGNALQPITGDIRLDSMPKHVLQEWDHLLATENVQRGPYGPVFSEESEDDPAYRAELRQKIQRGLGL